MAFNKMYISLFLVLVMAAASVFGQGTQVGFYGTSCPRAESIVASIVKSNFEADPKTAGRLLRLHFHDCFVRGCDASILIDGPDTEKASEFNAKVAGYEVVDAIKSLLEKECPGIVSCADILALAARDAIALTKGPVYDVLTGRRDGRVSIKKEADTLPGFGDTVDVQKQKFAAKGLDVHDLVTLVGGHTIGTTSCGSFRYRLYNFNRSSIPDPSIHPLLLPLLQSSCPLGGDLNNRVSLDTGSEIVFDTSFYTNLQNLKGVLQSDQRLWTDDTTRPLIESYLGVAGSAKLDFNAEFAKAMLKMGNIDVVTGNEGEIRRVCSVVN